MVFFTSVVFYCLPLLYNNSAILPSSYDAASKAYVHGIISQFAAASKRLGVSGEEIKIACKDYQLCKDTVNVSQSEVGEIKEKLEISKGKQEGGGGDTCETEHVVHMQKKMLECNGTTLALHSLVNYIHCIQQHIMMLHMTASFNNYLQQ